ncbi:MAG: DNA replication and repair protein RecF [Bacteroidota bacterium]
MIFNNLTLFNFKNINSALLEFSPEINCLVGKNGMGKTNILDALHYLSLGKSAFNPVDTANITYDQQAFSVKSKLQRSDSMHELLCSVQFGKKKTLKVNQKEYEKLSEHIGFIPVVMISPNDISLINNGNELRRKFFDATISQQDKVYLQNIVRYQKALKQRNSLLKYFSENMKVDQSRLEPFDNELLSLGEEIYKTREVFLRTFTEQFDTLYKKLSNEHERVEIIYESEWQSDNPKEKFKQAIKRDLALQRTTVGVHRDAYHFNIDGKPIRRFGSQGQQKSLIVALKIAQFETLKAVTKLTPALLLDDIFDKLDDERMRILLNMVCDHSFGQIFITDARPERTKAMLAENELPARIFEIKDGEIGKTEDYEPEKKK